MRKRAAALLLALALCLGPLPGGARAAESELPEWRFLFAIFKNVDADYRQNGAAKHTTYSMTQEEIDMIRGRAGAFEAYLNSVGVMRAHVEVAEIEAPVTELEDYSSSGGWLSIKQDAPLLAESGIDLDRYDHVTCVACLNDDMGYLGLGGSQYDNGTGHSFINLVNLEYCRYLLRISDFPAGAYVHEFLHFMENAHRRWGGEFDLHKVRLDHYMPDQDGGAGCYRDILLNQARGDAGTGVHPAAWSHSPRVLRTMTELEVPSGVAGIGGYAFQNHAHLTKVTIPGSVASIGDNAFQNCANLTEVNLCPGVTSIGKWTFGCSAGEENRGALKKVAIPASVTSIGYAAFYNISLTDVYYSGTREQWAAIQIDEYNGELTEAAIHYNSLMGGRELPNGTMTAGGQTVNWVYDPSSRSLTVSGSSDRNGTVFAAQYDGSGRFLGLAEVSGIQTLDLSGCGEARLFWAGDGTYRPLCGAPRIPTGS